MRVANLAGRAVLLTGSGAVDIHDASGGLFSPDPQALFGRWDDLAAWHACAGPRGHDEPEAYAETSLGPPVPKPRQVFAIGVNYADHAAEAGSGAEGKPPWPATFTKFPACLAGPYARVCLPAGLVDWEVELVVVIRRRARRITAADAWDCVAGLTVGQDLSERITQLSGPAPQQYSLGKSYPGFGPTGPAVVTLDEIADPGDLQIGCDLNGQTMQDARTSEMIFTVPELIEKLSAVTTLFPGDLIFTGTPAGIGGARTPPRFLRPGDVLTSSIEGVGTLRTSFQEA
jgi:2,4-didehydro-3-deoxy-L-rhamnonate hydrolase